MYVFKYVTIEPTLLVKGLNEEFGHYFTARKAGDQWAIQCELGRERMEEQWRQRVYGFIDGYYYRARNG